MPHALFRWLHRRPTAITAAGLLAIGLVLRLGAVHAWQQPAGDGLQYYALSQHLAAEHRLAYGAAPAPLRYCRLPGYPLFLAFVAVRDAPLSLEEHLVRATRWNALLDVGTAAVVFLLVEELAVGHGAALLGLLGVVSCPLLLMLSCHGLSETLATFLNSVELLLAVYAMRCNLVALAPVSGAVAGLAQLVRADSVTTVPAVFTLFFFATAERGRRILALAAFAIAAAAVFSPWAARNLLRFGAFHAAGCRWMDTEVKPLPAGAMSWMATWSGGRPGDAYLSLFLVNHAQLVKRDPETGRISGGAERFLRPAMFDDASERSRVLDLFTRYNQTGLSSDLDRDFEALAVERALRKPWRTYIALPALRMAALWTPIPSYELSAPPALERLHRFFGWWDAVVYALAACGGVALWHKGSRARAVVVAISLAIVTRTFLYAWVEPAGVTQRHLAESFPLLIALAASALTLRKALSSTNLAAASP